MAVRPRQGAVSFFRRMSEGRSIKARIGVWMLSHENPKGTLPLVVLLWVSSCVSVAASDGAAPPRINIPKAGKTVLTAMSPKGKAEVTIQTAQVDGECFDGSPAVNFTKESGAEEGSIVPHLSITVADEVIGVPPSVYSQLFNIMWASLSYKDGTFDLTINEGVDLYLVHIYFGARGGVKRLTGYDYVFRTLTEDARFHYGTLR